MLSRWLGAGVALAALWAAAIVLIRVPALQLLFYCFSAYAIMRLAARR